jgi:hypothetical protein
MCAVLSNVYAWDLYNLMLLSNYFDNIIVAKMLLLFLKILDVYRTIY